MFPVVRRVKNDENRNHEGEWNYEYFEESIIEENG
jgi:hypothetical protein